MINFILLIIILILMLYSYTTTDTQFEATSSVLRQIWSGGCPLSCRHSEYNSISGLSIRIASQTDQYQNIYPHHTQTITHGCVCETCPCILIENFISSCRPASTVYNQFMICTSNCIDYFIQMVIGIYEFLRRFLECQVTCQTRPVQLTNEANNEQHSNENIRIQKNRDEEENLVNIKKEKEGNSSLLIKPEEKDDRKKIIKDKKDREYVEAPSKKEKPTEIGPFNKTDKKVSSSHSSICGRRSDNTIECEPMCSAIEASQNNNCAKCYNKGRTCLKDCPKAHKKKKEK